MPRPDPSMTFEQRLVAHDQQWQRILAERPLVSLEEFQNHLSTLITYLLSEYVFISTQTLDASTLRILIESLLRGAKQLIAFLLSGPDNVDSRIIIHEKNPSFTVVRTFLTMLTQNEFDTSNVVYVRDPLMEKHISSSLTSTFFTLKREFVDGSKKSIGIPNAKSQIIIPLNYYFTNWLNLSYPLVIANYVKLLSDELERSSNIDVATMYNITLFLGMYNGYDSKAEVASSQINKDILILNEQNVLELLNGASVNILLASDHESDINDSYSHATCLVNYFFVEAFEHLKTLFAKDIADYLTLEGKLTTVKKIHFTGIASLFLLTREDLALPSNQILLMFTADILYKVENLRMANLKFANHYAQLISLIFLNYGIYNPYTPFQAKISNLIRAVEDRPELTLIKREKIIHNYSMFLDKYSDQKYTMRNKCIFTKKMREPDTDGLISAIPPNPKPTYIPIKTLSETHYSLFTKPKHQNKQLQTLVNTISQFANLYVLAPGRSF